MKLGHVAAALLGAVVMVLGACGLRQALPTQTEKLQHGPFEIAATGRNISAGGFPNTSGNPFATREVTSFGVRWRGQEVAVPGVGTRFWRVLRLADAAEPALLVTTTDAHLVTEQQGRLVVRSFGPPTTGLPELQWLDAEGGQPGGAHSLPIAVVEMPGGTELRGGRFLRVSPATVLDVQTLAHVSVQPLVAQGQTLAGLNAHGGAARAFSPGRTQFVVPASGHLADADGNHRRRDGLVVVDITGGDTYALPLDRQRMRLGELDDLHAAWIGHHFEWTRDSRGRERLVPRSGAKPMPWRGRIRRLRRPRRVPRAAGAAGDG